MRFNPGLFGHLPEWQASDRRGDRFDPRPTRLSTSSPRRRRFR
jgi:hypothetical protein